MSTFTATHDCNNNNTTIKSHSKSSYQLKLPVMSIEEKTRRLLGWIGETSTTSGEKTETGDRKMGTSRGGNKRKVPYMRPNGQQHSALTPPTSPTSSNEKPCLQLQVISTPLPRNRLSTASLSSTTSTSSSSIASPRSPVREPAATSSTDHMVIDRLRQIMPNLTPDQPSYQILVRTVSSVVDLEQQLQQLRQQTNVHVQQQETPKQIDMPDDLQMVDTTAFKTLLEEPLAQQLSIDV